VKPQHRRREQRDRKLPHQQRHCVTSQMLLQARLLVDTIGTGRLLPHLEKTQPQLTSYLLESWVPIHKQLIRDCGTSEKALRLHRRLMRLVVTCLLAMGRSVGATKNKQGQRHRGKR